MAHPDALLSGTNLPKVKQYNESVVFEAIRRHPGRSRAEVAERCGLTPATVTHIVKRLMAQGLLLEAEGDGDRRVGRPRLGLSLNGDGAWVVAGHLMVGSLQVTTANLEGRELAPARTLALPRDLDEAALAQRVADAFLEELKLPLPPGARRLGFGIGLPGPLRRDLGDRVVLAERLARMLPLPVVVENNGSAAAVGELWFGSAPELRDFLYVYIGSAGIGGGLVLDGEVRLGASLNIAEIGHVGIDLEGVLCECGLRGCAETVAGPSALADAYGGTLEALARDDSPEAGALRRLAARALSYAVVSAVNVTDVDEVVFGGQSPDIITSVYLPDGGESVRRQVFRRRSRDVTVRVSQLGSRAGLMGAASLIFHRRYFPTLVGGGGR